VVGVADIQHNYIRRNSCLKKRKQSTSVNKWYWYTSASMIVQVESVRGQRYARGALTCSLLICVFLLWAFLHSNKAVSAENLINFRGSSVATTKRPVHRRLAWIAYSANYMQISRFFFCSTNHAIINAVVAIKLFRHLWRQTLHSRRRSDVRSDGDFFRARALPSPLPPSPSLG